MGVMEMALIEIPEKLNSIPSQAPRKCDIKVKQTESTSGQLCNVNKDIRYYLPLWSVVCKGIGCCHWELSMMNSMVLMFASHKNQDLKCFQGDFYSLP